LGNDNNPYLVLVKVIDGTMSTCSINENCKQIFPYAFSACEFSSIVIPDSVITIGEYAFSYCQSLNEVYIGKGLATIGNMAFFECRNIQSVYITDLAAWCNISFASTTSNPLTANGDTAICCSDLYWNGELVPELVIPNEITNINSYAFAGCESIISVTIPASITSIGDWAFYYCTSLTSVTIPDSVTTIGSYAFAYCSSLTIYCEAASKQSGWDSSWNSSNRPVVWGYTGEEYSYNFVTNGGGEIESVTTDRAFTLPTPIKDGWYFGGWYDNAEFSGNPVSSPYYSKTAHTLYAKWMTEEEYLASLDGSSFEKAYIITSGESLPAVIDTAGEYVYFKFTATEAKTYTFQSSGSYDTYGYLYNVSQSQLSSNDDDGDGNNFKITRSMSAGEVAYIAVRMYSSSNTGTLTVTVS